MHRTSFLRYCVRSLSVRKQVAESPIMIKTRLPFQEASVRCLSTNDGGRRSKITDQFYPKKERIDAQVAKRMVKRMSEKERQLLADEISKYSKDATSSSGSNGGDDTKLSSMQAKALFSINCIPFIGFGFFDNFIMIIAGEYIDMTLGFYLGISTMAAAALGNMISDLAGVQLSLYIEACCLRLGLYTPDLTPAQAELPRTHRIIAAGKLIGITFGCLIGMFPLLFIADSDASKECDADDNKAANTHRSVA